MFDEAITSHSGHVCSMQRVSTVDTMGAILIHCNVTCASIEIQIICNLFWTLKAICHWILVAAQYSFLIKKSGCAVEYWIFRTALKGYLWRGLIRRYIIPHHVHIGSHLAYFCLNFIFNGISNPFYSCTHRAWDLNMSSISM